MFFKSLAGRLLISSDSQSYHVIITLSFVILLFTAATHQFRLGTNTHTVPSAPLLTYLWVKARSGMPIGLQLLIHNVAIHPAPHVIFKF